MQCSTWAPRFGKKVSFKVGFEHEVEQCKQVADYMYYMINSFSALGFPKEVRVVSTCAN